MSGEKKARDTSVNGVTRRKERDTGGLAAQPTNTLTTCTR